MRRNIMVAAILAVVALIVPMTGHAFTTIASCNSSASAPPSQACPKVFTCPVHPINLRAIPSFQFVGVVDVTVSDTAGNTFTHSSEWITGRIQIDGPTYTTVQMEPFVDCTLTVATSAGLFPPPVSGGTTLAVVEA